MAVTFTTADKPHVLGDPAGDRVRAFEERAHALLRAMLPKSADASPNLRAVLQTLTGSLLSAKERDAKLATMLADIQRRLGALEEQQDERGGPAR